MSCNDMANLVIVVVVVTNLLNVPIWTRKKVRPITLHEFASCL